MKLHRDFLKVLYDNISRVLEIEHLEPSHREAVLDALARQLESRIQDHISTIIAEPHLGRLRELISDDAVSHEVKFAHIHNHIPNFIEFVEKEVGEFSKELKRELKT